MIPKRFLTYLPSQMTYFLSVPQRLLSEAQCNCNVTLRHAEKTLRTAEINTNTLLGIISDNH